MIQADRHAHTHQHTLGKRERKQRNIIISEDKMKQCVKAGKRGECFNKQMEKSERRTQNSNGTKYAHPGTHTHTYSQQKTVCNLYANNRLYASSRQLYIERVSTHTDCLMTTDGTPGRENYTVEYK